MRASAILIVATVALSLAGCAVVGAGVSVAGPVVSTTVSVTGDVVGAVVNSDDDDD